MSTHIGSHLSSAHCYCLQELPLEESVAKFSQNAVLTLLPISERVEDRMIIYPKDFFRSWHALPIKKPKALRERDARSPFPRAAERIPDKFLHSSSSLVEVDRLIH